MPSVYSDSISTAAQLRRAQRSGARRRLSPATPRTLCAPLASRSLMWCPVEMWHLAAAVHEQFRAGDVPRTRRGEEQAGLGDVRRLGQTARRQTRPDQGRTFGAAVVGDQRLGEDRTADDRVDADARGPFQGQRL